MESCLHVRELLPEHALSALPGEERLFVERHLDWCAGCRKEAAELAAGAALAGRAVPQAAPPPELEQRVLRSVRQAAGSRPQRRRMPRFLSAAIVAVMALGMVGFGWGANTQVQHAREARKAAETRAEDLSKRMAEFIDSLIKQQQGPGPAGATGQARQGFLTPTPGRQGGGGVVVYVSPTDKDWALVVVGGMSRKLLPYRVVLRGSSGESLVIGRIRELGSDGGGQVWTRLPHDLRPFEVAIVQDRDGRPALRGTLS